VTVRTRQSSFGTKDILLLFVTDSSMGNSGLEEHVGLIDSESPEQDVECSLDGRAW
jgi:hypothetical protein